MKWYLPAVLLALTAAALFFVFADRLNDLAERNERAVATQTKVNEALAAQIAEDTKAEVAIVNYCTSNSILAEQNVQLTEVAQGEAQLIQQLENKLAEKPLGGSY